MVCAAEQERTGVRASAAAAPEDRHVLIILQHYLILLVQIEHRYRAECGRHATRLRHHARLGRVNEGLHDRVIRRVQMVRQRKRAITVAVEGVVSGRRDDPIVPADVREVDVERMPPAILAAVLPPVLPQGGPPGPPVHYLIRGCHLVAAVVHIRVEHRPAHHPRVLVLIDGPSQPHVFPRADERAGHVHQQPVIILMILQPSHHRWMHVQIYRGVLRRVDHLALDQPQYRLAVTLHPGPYYVVHQHPAALVLRAYILHVRHRDARQA